MPFKTKTGQQQKKLEWNENDFLGFIWQTKHIFFCWMYFMFSVSRPSTASTRSVCTAWLWCLPTRYLRLPWAASTYLRPNSASWRAPCTPATSSCALTRVSPTCPSRDKNSQVRRAYRHILFPHLFIAVYVLMSIWMLALTSLACMMMDVVVLDRGRSRFYDSGQPGGRKEDSTGLRERRGPARGQWPGT